MRREMVLCVGQDNFAVLQFIHAQKDETAAERDRPHSPAPNRRARRADLAFGRRLARLPLP